MNGRHLGSLVGTIGGVVFVLANLGGLDLPVVAAVVLVVVAVAAAVAVLLAIRADDGALPPAPTRQTITVYWVAVAAMVVAIPVGSAVLAGLVLLGWSWAGPALVGGTMKDDEAVPG